MKLMFASDIHGCAPSCELMLKRFDEEKAEKLFLLGDILYHGPRNDLPEGYAPKKVIAMLNERKADLLCVRGNCDTEVDQMVLEFPVLAEYSVIFDGDITMYLTHGHSRETLEKSLPAGSYLICGHTHVPEARECGGHTY
ncbi:MAG: phosphodiesterase, partial [Oscillospiraceae bacterium]|nr:phosphodiesterase [Oscillospiraceae bacterium]